MENRYEDILKFKRAVTPDDVIAIAAELEKKSPHVRFSYLGRSMRGRGIPMLTVGTPSASVGVLYVASHHASEWICTSILLRFLSELAELGRLGKTVFGVNTQTLLSSRYLTVIPMLNPDGVSIEQCGVSDDDIMKNRLIAMNGSNDFSRWQANGRGVDLNHNYDASFEAYKALETSFDVKGPGRSKYSGEYPESEVETALLCNHVRYDNKLAAAISLHTQGEVIYYKSKGVAPKESQGAANALAEMTGYSLSETEGSASYGGMTDWFIQKLGKPSFTIECGKGENPLDLSDGFDIYTRIREALFTFPILF